MKIYIDETIFEFTISVKKSNNEFLERRRSVETNSTIVNKYYVFPPTVLATSIQSQNIIISTYINNNNKDTYQGIQC